MDYEMMQMGTNHDGKGIQIGSYLILIITITSTLTIIVQYPHDCSHLYPYHYDRLHLYLVHMIDPNLTLIIDPICTFARMISFPICAICTLHTDPLLINTQFI